MEKRLAYQGDSDRLYRKKRRQIQDVQKNRVGSHIHRMEAPLLSDLLGMAYKKEER